jgi:NADPH:quinone reductase-like Zn-dependent oxidoreductase
VKAYEIQQFGVDHLALAERPSPEPGPGQVVVRMAAWSLNYRDMLVIEGKYNPRLKMPMVPFSDGAGEVLAVGEGVTRVAPGDRVAGIFMQSWLTGPYLDKHGKSAMGGAIDGVLAEQVLLSAEGLVKIPDHLTLEEAATLPCAAVTAWDAVVTEGKAKEGDTVLVLGSGGVSLFALQFARMRGARVIATTSSEERAERLRALGASDVVNYREQPDWEKKVRELTGGAGVDHVVEVGGAGTFSKSLAVARGGGRISVIGNLTGLTADVNVALILHKFLTVQGIFVGSRDTFEAMNTAISEARMQPVISHRFGFGEVKDSIRLMATGQHYGKITVAA